MYTFVTMYAISCVTYIMYNAFMQYFAVLTSTLYIFVFFSCSIMYVLYIHIYNSYLQYIPYTYTYVYVYLYICMYVGTYVRIYVHIYAYIVVRKNVFQF